MPFQPLPENLEELIGALTKTEAPFVLDLGCGEGHLGHILKQKGVSCWGLDRISPRMGTGANIVGDALRPPILAGKVDLILAGNLFSHPLFDYPSLHWIGLMTFRPATEDYVPLLPWMGVVLLGISAGHLLEKTTAGKQLLCWYLPFGFARILALAGRHSLLVYMLHQPVLLALLWPIAGFPGL